MNQLTRRVDKIRWYRNRLSAMSHEEIRHRVVEAVRRRTAKHSERLLVPAPADRGPLAPIPGLRERLRDWEVPEAAIAEWEEVAAELESGEFRLLGQQWPPCGSERWQIDPVTGGRWPQEAYTFDIDFRHTADFGDVKYVWELNRLQHLQPVAALAFKRGDAELAARVLAELESWIEHNPPFRGVAWASGIELALRAVSILTVTTLVGEHLSIPLRARIWATLEAHGLWLERFPSRFSSANNHLIAEALGLLAIGTLCSELPQAEAWRELGAAVLAAEVTRQILPDGVGAEQSPTYTAMTIEMLLFGRMLVEHADGEVPRDYVERLASCGECLRWFTDGGGNQPQIGDNDDGRVFGVHRPGEMYVTSVLGCLAAHLGRADLVPPNVPPHLRQAVFGFPVQPGPGPEGLRSFVAGGYSVVRHRVANREFMLAFDHGPLGYLSIAAHGHADALSIWLHLDGKPMLVDAGTYLYHSGGEWRRHFRGTSAHNTLSIGGIDSSVMAGNFNWSEKANGRLVRSGWQKDGWFVEAEHDGYTGRMGVTHVRRLDFSLAAGLTITDMLRGAGTHRVEIAFLLHPALTPLMQGHEVVVREEAREVFRMGHLGGLDMVVDDPYSPSGWHSPTFGVKHAASRILLRGLLAAGQPVTTRISIGQRPD